MNSVNSGKTDTSDVTSKTLPKVVSEQDFLAGQAQQAQQAIGNVLKQMTQTVTDNVDPRHWPQTHPWVYVGSAAAAGFVAGCMLTPTGDQGVRDHLEQLIKQCKPAVGKKTEPERESQPSVYSTLRSTLTAMLTQAISGALISATHHLTKGADEPPPSARGNGPPEEPERSRIDPSTASA